MSSKNNAQVEIRFRDVYPTGLTGLQYDQQANDVDYLTATVSFQYLVYDFASVVSSTTIVTTSLTLQKNVFVVYYILWSYYGFRTITRFGWKETKN